MKDKIKIFEIPTTKYYVYLPIEGEYRSSPGYEDSSIFKCLDYAYGVGTFRITSNHGFQVTFNPEDYSEKDIKRAGYLESFDFITHNILTKKELDIWKIYVRNEDMY